MDYMSSRRRFLAAVSKGLVDRPALGTVTSMATTDAMDACGAAFPESHLDAERMAKLAAFIGLESGFDMMFPVYSVVHESAALGAKTQWGRKDVMPAIVEPPWQTADDIKIPDNFEEQPSMKVVTDALALLRKKHGTHYAIIGKVFGPWSLGFHLFGVEKILIMTIENPDELRRIFRGLARVTVRSALAQIKAGADVLCLGDHCSMDMCSPDTYREFLFPMHQQLAREIPCPVVLHTCGDTADRIASFAETTLSGFHFDTRVPAAKAVQLAGGRMSIMGGVSNIHSLLHGNVESIRADVAKAVEAGVNIIGPECAVPLDTKLASLKAISSALKDALASAS